MRITKNAPTATPTDPRLVDVAQATMDQVEHAVAVSQAPTADAAFDLLSGLAAQQERRRLLDACVHADAATTKGHLAVKTLLAQDSPVPASWLDRLVELEHERLNAVWALGDWDAARTRPADVEATTPTALAVRLMTPATRRIGELDPPDGPEIRAALAWLDECGPGWDSETTREAGRRLVAAAVRHGGVGRTGAPS